MDINTSSGQIEVISEEGIVYLYTHNTAASLVKDVHEVLSLRLRWNDADYLARMLFCKMVPPESWSTDKGFGIGTQLYTDIDLLITLDIKHEMITVQSAKDIHNKYRMPFSKFVDSFFSEASI